MNIPEMYDYLVRARRDLWTALEGVPDDVLNAPLLNGDSFHSIKDLAFHIPSTEDGWLHYTIIQDKPVRHTMPALSDKEIGNGPLKTEFPLETLLSYWRAVEQSTLAYFEKLTPEELNRIVEDSPEEHFKLDGLLWHVMIHEMRHTAQICVLLRTQGIKPPALDLLWYLPNLKPSSDTPSKIA